MLKKNIIYLITSFISLSFFFSCNDDDNFSTDSSLRLTFSKDTVSFDTVFTTLGSSTRQLKVYNKNKDGIAIDNIELINASRSGFRMTVDGLSKSSVDNINILGKDSLYVYIEITIDPLNKDNSVIITDSIRFRFNGVTQYVHLEAIGQDVIIWRGKKIEKDTTIEARKPFLIYDSLYVKNGVTLNIDKNTHFYFHKNASLSVAGTVKAIGTIEEPIIFRADRTDYLSENPRLPYDRVPGQWNGIRLSSDSYNNHFENVRIRNSEYGLFCLPSDILQTKVTFINSIIQNTSKEGLTAINAKIDAKNSLFANAGTYSIKLTGGNYNFLHCTIANYMAYPGTSRMGTLYVSNSGLNVTNINYTAALTSCNFINTIIAGSTNGKKEIILDAWDNLTFNYQFINCLLKISGKDDVYFSNIVWNEDPEFAYIYKSDDLKTDPNLTYYYNFELSENSKAINKGSRKYAADLPLDIKGISRINDDGPDIGCFEWKAN